MKELDKLMVPIEIAEAMYKAMGEAHSHLFSNNPKDIIPVEKTLHDSFRAYEKWKESLLFINIEKLDKNDYAEQVEADIFYMISIARKNGVKCILRKYLKECFENYHNRCIEDNKNEQ